MIDTLSVLQQEENNFSRNKSKILFKHIRYIFPFVTIRRFNKIVGAVF